MPATRTAAALLAAAIAIAALSGCQGTDGGHPPVVYDIGRIHRSVTTASPEAQRWFDRGIALTFGFNHEEAVLCFEKAAEIDPGCAMAHWGKAYALGPNYNSPVLTGDASREAAAALRRALDALDDETPVEHALVRALQARYRHPEPGDRSGLDRAFAAAMKEVYAAHPDDPDVCSFAAEAAMQLRPWKLWSSAGEPAPETPGILAILEEGLRRWPDHPGLCHLYIHAMEAGPDASLAVPVARRLERLAPGLGHLVHMPSHIYVWTGQYEDVVRTNVEACKVDDAYVRVRGRNNFYTGYRIHNYHFVAYGGMWEGRRELALRYARAIPGEIDPALLAAYPDIFDIFVATPYHVMVRFGMWEEILGEPAPPATPDLLATRAVWRYARGVALAALGRVPEAEAEQAAFLRAREEVPETRFLFQNPVHNVLAVAGKVLDGEIAYRRGDHDQAFALLREAVALDDDLNYDEPWGWMEPVRHALGALLTEQGRYGEAIDVYRRDLERYPENGWALHGLAECLEGLGRAGEAASARSRFQRAWARADTEIPGSCFCRTR